ncbi:zinc-ribbon domain-containing protein [Haladaptatus cibarius]|uniref:zinc-ribbon domain-containing protein n=1 Tax=Haladaptatus cibarius TaxID=453847 RepID=UPI000679333F|nr:zinc-ribbon domain-containing protein [Haladaptatus cibarius]
MENPLVAAGLALIAWSIGISFGPVGVFIAGFLLVALGLSSVQIDGLSWNGCPTCGKKIDRNDNICQHCGTRLPEE